MATFNGTTGNDRATPTNGVLGFTTGTLAELIDGTGDQFFPGDGSDTVDAGSGNDTFFGSAGADQMFGHNGDDFYQYGAASEVTSDTINGGADTDVLAITFTGAANFQSTSITSIEVFAFFGAGAATATFNGSQLGGGLASSLTIQGVSGSAQEFTFNNVTSNFSFDISNFSFSIWDQAQDRININVGSTSTDIRGSFVADMVNGGNGDDSITGGTGADTLRGGAGDDIFIYNSQVEITGDSIDGGAAGAVRDVIQINYAGVADFTGATIASTGTTSIEEVRNVAIGNRDFIFNASQIGTNGLSSNLRIVTVGNGIDRLIINNVDGTLDLSTFNLVGWSDVSDKVIINAINLGSNNIRGSSFADEVNGNSNFDLIHGTLGADTLRGGAGIDTFRYASAAELENDSIDGGADNDTIDIQFAGTVNFSAVPVSSTATTSIETLQLNGTGNTNVIFDASAVSTTGFSESLNVSRVVGFTDSLTFNNVSGTLNIFNFSFTNWTSGTDQIVFNGGAGAEVIVGSNQDEIFNGSAGADNLQGNGNQDRFVYQTTAQATGDSIDGGVTGVNDDVIEVTGSAVDFTSASITSIERLVFTRVGGHTVTFSEPQFGNGLSSSLGVQGFTQSADTVIINNVGTFASNFTLANIGLTDWEAEDRFIINVTVAGTNVVGSAGNDTINGSMGIDFINGSLGNDRLNGGLSNDRFFYANNADIGSDTIDGGARDALDPLDGDRLVIEFAGLADFRNATIASTGSSSIEQLLTGVGAHDIRFNAAQFGGNGLSTALIVATGTGNGADIITFDNANGSLNLSGLSFFPGWDNAADRIVINGGAGADSLTGSIEKDIINGGIGNDTLSGGVGDDTIDGGADSDVLSFFSLTTALVMTLSASSGIISVAGQGTDTYSSIEGLGGSNIGDDNLSGNASANVLLGYGGNDTLDGGTGNDRLEGGAGLDSLVGGAEDDTLDGGAGADRMIGGTGNDRFIVDSTGDRLFDLAGEGAADIVVSSLSYALLSTAEIEYFEAATGTTAITLLANNFSQTLVGNDGINVLKGFLGNDTIHGGLGNDQLWGGRGNDSLTGGAGLDSFVFEQALSSTSNKDVITDFNVADDRFLLDDAIFTGFAGALGTIAANRFLVGSNATAIDHRIVYEQATGKVFYDADGSGAGAKILFAEVTANLALTRSDFVLF
jgi:serralysin